VASRCEHGSETPSYIKAREFLDQPIIVLSSQEGLCSIELVAKICRLIPIFFNIGQQQRALHMKN
jgi:hypothetical protein